MAPDLSEKLLGIDIDGVDGQQQEHADGTDEPDEERKRFVFFESGPHRLAVSVDAVRTLAKRPDEVTRVPRTPPAIEGMVDLRGEVTAVVDPGVHFPSDEERTTDGRERLLVLDRPADEQSVALRVDDVIGVESIPESDILDETAIEDRRLSGDTLEHPLVTALLEQEHEHDADESSVTTPSETGHTAETGGGGLLSSAESEATTDDGSTLPNTVVIEVTPLVDVERLLQASSHRNRPE
ncbi:chemotaxis protein CheW [Natronorubrum sulfidifaciens]|uniref:Chemotaxis protein CheW n=1 Tax=Natronorubrum sulfidifaciens JCM 14089 TaxID=1230460 RepID=L9W552_9EURY|nr:chemotaxis protein CheW [Natronorubrum sulfidifaciens]ELY44472.1 chemotaxis protein CheW [Natronorubrum sulfidifaciens JCM 14089]